MPIAYLSDLIRHARSTRTAIPGAAIDDLRGLTEAMAAAAAAESPIVISIDDAAFADVGFDAAMAAVEHAAAAADIPIALNARHVRSEQALNAAIRSGFCGVTLAAEIPETGAAELAAIGASCGVAVGADLGRASAIAALPTGLAFAEISLNAGGGNRLDDGRSLGLPLAVRGSSGVSAEAMDGLLSAGACWVEHSPGVGDLTDLISSLGSVGRSAEFLAACRIWTSVEHIVEFNAPDLSADEVADLLALGTKQLGAVPGVRDVRTGEAAAADARYRFSWFIRFASAEVIDSFNKHPLHVAFADDHFRPVAADRLTTNYVMHNATDFEPAMVDAMPAKTRSLQ